MNFKAIEKKQYWVLTCSCGAVSKQLSVVKYTLPQAAESFYLDGWITDKRTATCISCQRGA